MTLIEQVRRALSAPIDAAHPQDERHIPPEGGRHIDAAVLIAITDRDIPGVILTQRPGSMRSHAGQVAFPGGKIDPEDRDAIAAALREADEEIALPPHKVAVIGTSDTYFSGSGFAITPVIGVIPPDLPFRPNPVEVESWFETPLDYLLDMQNHERHAVDWRGARREYSEILWNDRRIWGVTAGIIANFARRLNAVRA